MGTVLKWEVLSILENGYCKRLPELEFGYPAMAAYRDRLLAHCKSTGEAESLEAQVPQGLRGHVNLSQVHVITALSQFVAVGNRCQVRRRSAARSLNGANGSVAVFMNEPSRVPLRRSMGRC
jgi:hypothetical protein